MVGDGLAVRDDVNADGCVNDMKDPSDRDRRPDGDLLLLLGPCID